MSTVIKSIDVDIPASTVFEQWTRFEELPRFMGGVVAVQRLDDRHLHWRAQMIGVERVWELELTEITSTAPSCSSRCQRSTRASPWRSISIRRAFSRK